MEKEIVMEYDNLFENQNKINWKLFEHIVEQGREIKELKKEVTGLIILQGLSALALVVVAIWG